MVYPFYCGLVHVANKFHPKHLKKNNSYPTSLAMRSNTFDEQATDEIKRRKRRTLALLKKNEHGKNEEDSDKMLTCDLCGKTVRNIVQHADKHLCRECYQEIFEE